MAEPMYTLKVSAQMLKVAKERFHNDHCECSGKRGQEYDIRGLTDSARVVRIIRIVPLNHEWVVRFAFSNLEGVTLLSVYDV